MQTLPLHTIKTYKLFRVQVLQFLYEQMQIWYRPYLTVQLAKNSLYLYNIILTVWHI